ncbi:MAG TPA: T9SS type A sorting domain-containing protein [Flavobacterium sp.]|jgi:uncharacterized repeat protein (TIGR01451 family)
MKSINILLATLFLLLINFIGLAQVNAVDDYIFNANAAMGGMIQQSGNFPYFYRVLLNDSVDGSAPYDQVDLIQVSTSNPGLSIDNSGYLHIDPATPPGDYVVVYQLCRISNAADCDMATVNVEVCNITEPTISVSQPDCTSSNGTITINGLPLGNWTIKCRTYFTNLPNITGTGTTYSMSLAPDYYYIKVVNDDGCTSEELLVAVDTPDGWNITPVGTYVDFNNNGVTDVGDIINWQLNIENLFTCPLTNIQLVNTDVSWTGGPITSIPGSSTNSQLTATSILTQDQINSGSGYCFVWLSADSNAGDQYDKVIGQMPLNIVDGIRLNAFIDTDNNGIQNGGEVNFPDGTFHFEMNNNGYVHDIYSSNGTYIIYETNPANTFDISLDIPTYCAAQFIISPSSYSNINVAPGSGIITYNFPITIVPCSDLSVFVNRRETPRPGFPYSHWISYHNAGNQTIPSGTITFTNDDAVSVSAVSLPGAVINASGFSYSFTNLQPYDYIFFYVTMDTPATVPLGTSLTSNIEITIPVSDTYPINNSDAITEIVSSSYDPNDMSETHGNQIPFAEFTSDEFLRYTIRFENTGNANAINITIVDILDEKLDPASVRMVMSSHPYVLDKIGNNLTWTFSAVNLPPSVSGTDTGKGFLTFEVKPLPGYEIGDVIPNSADIYFDANPAIVTNTWTTEFVNELGVNDFNQSVIKIYPNPTKDNITISSTTDLKEVIVRDISGKKLLQKPCGVTVTQLDLQSFSEGIYFLEITSASRHETFRIIKE